MKPSVMMIVSVFSILATVACGAPAESATDMSTSGTPSALNGADAAATEPPSRENATTMEDVDNELPSAPSTTKPAGHPLPRAE